MTLNHTPGPFHRVGSAIYALNADGTNRLYIPVQAGYLDDGSRTSLEECEATARLIAEAPAMKDALEHLILVFWTNGKDLESVRRAEVENAQAILTRLEA